MNFEQFSQGKSFLHQLDTRVKLISSLILVLIIALSEVFPTAFAGLVLGLLLVVVARLEIPSVLRRLLLVNGFVAFLWLTLPLSYPGDTAFTVGPFTISYQGILLASLITIKTNAIILILISLIATSSVTDLGHSLGKLKMPVKFCLLLLFSYRYIFVINQEFQRLVRAARLRCFSPATTMHTYRTFSYLFGMTLIKSHHRAERVQQAMVLRGFQGKFYSLHTSALGPNEIVFSILVALAAAGLLYFELLY